MGRFWCCTSLKKLFSFLQQPPVAGSASAIGSLWTPPPTLSVLGFLSVLILHNSCSCRPSYCGFMYAMGLPCPEKPVSLQSQATSVSYYFFFFGRFFLYDLWTFGQRGITLMFHLRLSSPQSLFSVEWLQVPVFIDTYWKRKLLWWPLRVSLRVQSQN